MNDEKLYTKQELDIELLKQKNDSFGQTLTRLESRVDSTLNLVLGLYAIIIGGLLAAVGKSFHIF